MELLADFDDAVRWFVGGHDAAHVERVVAFQAVALDFLDFEFDGLALGEEALVFFLELGLVVPLYVCSAWGFERAADAREGWHLGHGTSVCIEDKCYDSANAGGEMVKFCENLAGFITQEGRPPDLWVVRGTRSECGIR